MFLFFFVYGGDEIFCIIVSMYDCIFVYYVFLFCFEKLIFGNLWVFKVVIYNNRLRYGCVVVDGLWVEKILRLWEKGDNLKILLNRKFCLVLFDVGGVVFCLYIV